MTADDVWTILEGGDYPVGSVVVAARTVVGYEKIAKRGTVMVVEGYLKSPISGRIGYVCRTARGEEVRAWKHEIALRERSDDDAG